MSLRGKLLAAMVAIVVATMALSGLFTRRFAHDQLERVFVAGLDRPDLGPLRDHFARRGSWDGVGPVIEAMRRTVVLSTPDGRLLAVSRDLRGASVRVGPRDRITIVRGGRLLILHLEPTPVGGALAYVFQDGVPLPLREIASLDRRLLFTFAAATLVAALVAIFVSRRVTRPVEELTSAVEGLARGATPSRVTVEGKDELARLARSFNAMADALAAQQELRRRMAGDVAHELRTPLAGLRCELEAVQDGLATLDATAVASLHEQVLHLGRLVDDLQDLAIAEAGELRLASARLDLAATVARASEVPADARRVEVDAPVPPLFVTGDATRLRQVVANLVANALRYTPEGGRVTVAVRHAGTEAIVSVTDDGPGIPPDELENVFERFYRLDPARTRAEGGAGLGLAISRRLVEAHGGRIRAENVPGRGARFTFSIPIARS